MAGSAFFERSVGVILRFPLLQLLALMGADMLHCQLICRRQGTNSASSNALSHDACTWGQNMHRDLILSLGITSLHGQAFSTVRPIIKCAVTRMRRYLNRAVCLSSCVWHSGGDYCTAFQAALLRRIAHLMLRTQGTPTIPTRSSSIRNIKRWAQDKSG